MTNMRRLLDLKQSVWLDYLSRGNDTIRRAAHADRRRLARHDVESHDLRARDRSYLRLRRDLTELANSTRTDREIYETLAIEDVQEAADVFRAVFDSTAGGDGFVSLEVSPRLARDTEGSVAAARRL
jgi:hypothetical protein